MVIPKIVQDVLSQTQEKDTIEFGDPAELFEIFTDLEDKNLFLIQQLQESEETLEKRKHEF